MKIKYTYPLPVGILVMAAFSFLSFQAQQQEPWTATQLMDPGDLARILNDPKAKQPVVLSVGPAAVIKNSIDMGPASEQANLDKLRQHVSNLKKDESIILYCGCCPFDKCPNVRPAFNLLNQMEFENHRLLNLSQNLKVNWIDHGYPVSE